MNELVLTLLQTLVAIAVPILSAFVVRYLKTATDNEKAHMYIDDIADAVSTAVLATAQTYTDALKKSGEWTKEAQVTALNKAVSQARTMMTEETTKFVEKKYGNVNDYLVAMVEAEVRLQK